MFRSSLSPVTLTWASEISSSGSSMSSYVPSTNDIISICNAVVEISEVLEYSFPSLNSWFSKYLKPRKQSFHFLLTGQSFME